MLKTTETLLRAPASPVEEQVSTGPTRGDIVFHTEHGTIIEHGTIRACPAHEFSGVQSPAGLVSQRLQLRLQNGPADLHGGGTDRHPKEQFDHSASFSPAANVRNGSKAGTQPIVRHGWKTDVRVEFAASDANLNVAPRICAV
jgi:hypothetical protein